MNLTCDLTCDLTFDLCLQVLGLAVVGCAVWILFDGESLLNVIATGNTDVLQLTVKGTAQHSDTLQHVVSLA